MGSGSAPIVITEWYHLQVCSHLMSASVQSLWWPRPAILYCRHPLAGQFSSSDRCPVCWTFLLVHIEEITAILPIIIPIIREAHSLKQVFQCILWYAFLHWTGYIKVFCFWIHLPDRSVSTEHVGNFNVLKTADTMRYNANMIYRSSWRIVVGFKPVVVNEVQHVVPHPPCSLPFPKSKNRLTNTNTNIVDTITLWETKCLWLWKNKCPHCHP